MTMRATALSLMMVGGLVGCSKTENKSAGTAKGNGKKIAIALIAKSSTNPVFLAARTGAEAAARNTGFVELFAIRAIAIFFPFPFAVAADLFSVFEQATRPATIIRDSAVARIVMRSLYRFV